MDMLVDLWMAIVASAVGVWILAAIFWMVLPHHQKDYQPLGDEAGFSASLRSLGVGAGNYSFPYCSGKADHKDPEFIARWKEGPTGFLTVLGGWSMGRNMVLTLLVYLVVSVFVAYVTGLALEPGASFWKVFQVAGTCGVMAYTFGGIPNAIWFGASRHSVLMNVIDGVAYGLLVGVVFALLWPAGVGG